MEWKHCVIVVNTTGMSTNSPPSLDGILFSSLVKLQSLVPMDVETRVAAVTGGKTRKQLTKAAERAESRLEKVKAEFETYKERDHMNGNNKMWAIITCALVAGVMTIVTWIGVCHWQSDKITASSSSSEIAYLSSCLEKCTLPGHGCPSKCSTTFLSRCIASCGKDKACTKLCFAPLAKSVRRVAANRVIPGSIPGGSSKKVTPLLLPYPVIIDTAKKPAEKKP